MINLPLNAPSPRLCVIKKEFENQEYGFNLHAERGKGQFVGAVDKGSPAEKVNKYLNICLIKNIKGWFKDRRSDIRC